MCGLGVYVCGVCGECVCELVGCVYVCGVFVLGVYDVFVLWCLCAAFVVGCVCEVCFS